MAVMNKTLIFHHINDLDNIPAMERWFVQCHCPQVMAQEPWLTRYVMFRAMPPAEGMKELAFFNYRVHENLGLSVEGRRSLRGLLGMTPEPVDNAMTVAIANVPAEPTEDFFGQTMNHADGAFIRFVYMMSYPRGVSREEGEDWFLNTFAPEACKLPGLLRFFSHKAYDKQYPPIPLPEGTGTPEFVDVGEDNIFFHRWDRVCELWFRNNSAWTNAFVKNPPAWTVPAWATRDTFPFVEPGKDFVCTSLLERPDQNMLKYYDGCIF